MLAAHPYLRSTYKLKRLPGNIDGACQVARFHFTTNSHSHLRTFVPVTPSPWGLLRKLFSCLVSSGHSSVPSKVPHSVMPSLTKVFNVIYHHHYMHTPHISLHYILNRADDYFK